MYSKIFNILLAFGLAIFQLGFVSGLPGYLSSLNLIIIVLLFILVLGDLKTALFWSLVTGFLVDLFSFTPFGLNLISLTITIIATNFLLVGFFTDRSLYSFLTLTIVASFTCQFISTSLFSITRLMDGTSISLGSSYYSGLVKELFINLLISAVLFQIVNYISHKFKPVFLNKEKRI
ncbi:MAG: hypothetical protein UT48_C0002G0023 [Parcubacteria group bacterium GW2011_GWE2_39_37]|uniref:Rod shape-determining protein MreD n=1 Tax=Candidatus Falkowbacteria bacterium GW2011_GWF2_39_8 TaxID=1618642 RepID=A0A0G0PSE6_9BACT|nr:MAG: hypothetical protein UT48_C0002G0023 [Parcubacteria group bacterium GW2011_GWE2_39_37]KKR31079.1 MAG: hypothetical protein UT64_C0075G0006 [Candidatus Falkowbacteria bacterium GW2011_GWF2_39_8]